jgi:hypothetical protein
MVLVLAAITQMLQAVLVELLQNLKILVALKEAAVFMAAVQVMV